MKARVNYGTTDPHPTILASLTQMDKMIASVVGEGAGGEMVNFSHSVTPVGRKYIASFYYVWVDLN